MPKPFNRNERSVVETASGIVQIVTGSHQPAVGYDLDAAIEWLDQRVNHHWMSSVHHKAYENAVRLMAQEAVRIGRQHQNRRLHGMLPR